MKRVLFFGIFDPKYSRSRVLQEGFEANGYEVALCRVNPKEERGFKKYVALWRQGRSLRTEPFEQVLVLFPGHTVVWLARILFGKRIIFDAFVSLFDSNVHDRQVYGPISLRAWRDRFLDRFSCALAQTVLVDTEMHRQYFIQKIGVPAEKIISVPVGTTQAWFDAGEEPSKPHQPIVVGFYGTYIPLHGVPTIVRAAHELMGEAIRFRLIGGGQEYERVRAFAHQLQCTNIEFLPAMPREETIAAMRGADICLGVFGDAEKATRVVPNKVYECAALGKPIITTDTPGIHEAFSDDEMVFVPAGNAHALAQAIHNLEQDASGRIEIGYAARKRMQEHFTPERIVRSLLQGLVGGI